MYSAAEFFSGCGGFSRGFSQSGRFETVLANDIKPEALKSFEVNHANVGMTPITVREDIRLLSLDRIEEHLKAQGVNRQSLDCLIGGPPCQGFSQLRRSEERENGQVVKFRGYSKLSSDPRNDLVLRYLEVAERLKPKFIVIENVPQMLNHGFDGRLGRLSETVVEILERDLGYSVVVDVLTAADYGVPQLRDRAFFIASSVGAASFPIATHSNPKSTGFAATSKEPWITVKQAIGDLPKPNCGVDLGGSDLSHYSVNADPYAILMRSQTAFPHNHITRTYSDSVLNIIRCMREGETWDAASLRMQKKYARLLEKYAENNNVSTKRALASLTKSGEINSTFYKDYYWSAYTRLAWDEPALTITANANFLGSGRFTHPKEMRGITVREAARLQSFDDDFKFVTSATDQNRTDKIGVAMDMIGEAVPPLLGKAIATHIADQLDKKRI